MVVENGDISIMCRKVMKGLFFSKRVLWKYSTKILDSCRRLKGEYAFVNFKYEALYKGIFFTAVRVGKYYLLFRYTHKTSGPEKFRPRKAL
jgi:hypothetical protein